MHLNLVCAFKFSKENKYFIFRWSTTFAIGTFYLVWNENGIGLNGIFVKSEFIEACA